MTSPNPSRWKRAAIAVDAVLALLAVLLVLQVWLLTASVESWLAGHRDVAIPAAVLSGLLFLGAAGLLMLTRSAGRRASENSTRKEKSTC